MTYSATDMGDLMEYDDFCARVYADKRMPPGTRELVLALLWTELRDPERGQTTNTQRAIRLLGRDRIGGTRFRKLVLEDLPRYEGQNEWSGACEGPRFRPYRPRKPVSTGYAFALDDNGPVLRRAEPERDDRYCGAHATIRVVEHDMVTGWVRTPNKVSGSSVGASR